MIRAGLALAPLAGVVLAGTLPARALDCRQAAAALERAEALLPDPAALPTDRQITCISLEYNLDFARRLAALAAQCPAEPIAAKLPAYRTAAEAQTQTFAQRRCQPGLP